MKTFPVRTSDGVVLFVCLFKWGPKRPRRGRTMTTAAWNRCTLAAAAAAVAFAVETFVGLVD